MPSPLPRTNFSIRRAEYVYARTVDGEPMLLNMRTGVFFGLDQLGQRVWKEIEGTITLSALIERFLGESGASEADISDGLRTFLTQLRDNGLVSIL